MPSFFSSGCGLCAGLCASSLELGMRSVPLSSSSSRRILLRPPVRQHSSRMGLPCTRPAASPQSGLSSEAQALHIVPLLRDVGGGGLSLNDLATWAVALPIWASSAAGLAMAYFSRCGGIRCTAAHMQIPCWADIFLLIIAKVIGYVDPATHVPRSPKFSVVKDRTGLVQPAPYNQWQHQHVEANGVK